MHYVRTLSKHVDDIVSDDRIIDNDTVRFTDTEINLSDSTCKIIKIFSFFNINVNKSENRFLIGWTIYNILGFKYMDVSWLNSFGSFSIYKKVQLCTCNKWMKPNISLACKKSCFPPVKLVLGILPCNPNRNPNANPNPNPDRRAIFLGGNCPDTVKSKKTKNRKEIKSNRGKKKEIKQKKLFFIKLKQTFPKN